MKKIRLNGYDYFQKPSSIRPARDNSVPVSLILSNLERLSNHSQDQVIEILYHNAYLVRERVPVPCLRCQDNPGVETEEKS